MARVLERPDVPDDWIRLRDGVTPYRYLERIAIAHLDGGLSLREAHELATRELTADFTGGYTPLARDR